ncbi:MAG: hypothetical protein NVS4B8_24460 [Herpetosiphon sp.]
MTTAIVTNAAAAVNIDQLYRAWVQANEAASEVFGFMFDSEFGLNLAKLSPGAPFGVLPPYWLREISVAQKPADVASSRYE